MPGKGAANAASRAKQVAATGAAVTGGSGVAASGVAGDGVQQATEPAANTAATAVGADPSLGPAILLIAAVVIVVIGVVVADRVE